MEKKADEKVAPVAENAVAQDVGHERIGRANDNAVKSADDAFGTSVGSE